MAKVIRTKVAVFELGNRDTRCLLNVRSWYLLDESCRPAGGSPQFEFSASLSSGQSML